jgi:hypothetical protein
MLVSDWPRRLSPELPTMGASSDDFTPLLASLDREFGPEDVIRALLAH